MATQPDQKNGQELGLKNEESLLNCIKMQGWIREREASLITGMSDYTVGVVARRLEGKGEIFRDRTLGNVGHFLRLTAKVRSGLVVRAARIFLSPIAGDIMRWQSIRCTFWQA